MPGHQHFLSGPVVATALMQFNAFQVGAGDSLWIFTHATCRAIAYSCAAQPLWMISGLLKGSVYKRSSDRKSFTEDGLHLCTSKTSSLTFVCHLMLEDMIFV